MKMEIQQYNRKKNRKRLKAQTSQGVGNNE